jgi:hypothetical protein
MSQIASVAYPLVLADKRKAANQWHNSACLREFERQGIVDRKAFGDTIDIPLDYRENPDAGVVADDTTEVSLTPTEVVTTAVYTPALIRVPVKWTRRHEAMSEDDKIDLMKTLSANGIDTHDQLVERFIFTTSAAGGDEVNGLDELLPLGGQATVGTIASGTDAWFRHYSADYTAADIQQQMTLAYLSAAETGSEPTIVVSGLTAQAYFEDSQSDKQRFIDTQELKAGFKVLGFKKARYVHSSEGSELIYMFSKDCFRTVVSNRLWRAKGSEQEFDRAPGSRYFIDSLLQNVIRKKSAGAVLAFDESA